MRIAIIGNFSKGSYAAGIAKEVNKTHTAHIYHTLEIEGLKGVKPMSEILGNDPIEFIIVIQSHLHMYNDTDIPLLLYKRENDKLTVDNPNFVFLKYGVYIAPMYRSNHPRLYPAINPIRHNSNRKKEYTIVDIAWFPLPVDEYLDYLEKSQFMIIKTDNYVEVRALEAMASRTIPIIIYRSPKLRQLYEDMGITEEVAYFIHYNHFDDTVLIPKYDKEMAQRGYDLIHERFLVEHRAKYILEMIENWLKKVL